MDSRTYVADFWIVLVVGVFVWSVLFGVASGAIRKHQGGRFGNGFAWGFFLGFIGLIVVLATRPERPPTVIYVQSPTSPVQHVPQVRVAAENGYVPEPRRSASRRHPMPFSAWFALGLLLAIGVVSLINSVQDTSSTPERLRVPR